MPKLVCVKDWCESSSNKSSVTHNVCVLSWSRPISLCKVSRTAALFDPMILHAKTPIRMKSTSTGGKSPNLRRHVLSDCDELKQEWNIHQTNTKITEVNISVCVYRLFREDFPPLLRTIIDDFSTTFIHILIGFLDGSINPSFKNVWFTGHRWTIECGHSDQMPILWLRNHLQLFWRVEGNLHETVCRQIQIKQRL